MATTTTTTNALAQVVVLNNGAGITVVPTGTPLTSLNYFDGKFLRATDFALEQTYQRKLVAFSNQGLGSGVVYGYDVTLGDGDLLQIGPGLGIDPGGGVLLLPGTVSVGVQDLIDASRPQATVATAATAAARKKVEPNAVFTDSAAFSDCLEVTPPPPSTVVPAGNLYVVVLCSAEALCGQQDVMGSICDAACVTATDRPYRLDSVVVRAIPLQLVTPFPASKTVSIDADLYLRSKVAHAYFGDEVARHPAQISRQGLLSDTWCLGAGYDPSCCEVPIAVIARSGSATTFLDAWIGRRERMSTPPHRYWQWRMRMRPWEVFMAQVLQFQCQLAEVLTGAAAPDPAIARKQTSALGNAAQFLDGLRTSLTNAPSGASLLGLSFTHLADLQQQLQVALKNVVGTAAPANRILIQGGVLELPPAGYLPVMAGSTISVNDQVRALLGEGLDLRFCVVTADYVAHALETAQHMDRISLLQGLDDPSNKPKVDILVPGGTLAPATTTNAGGFFDAALAIGAGTTGASYKGAAREEALPSGGAALYSAGAGLSLGLVHEAATLSASYGKGEKVSAAAVAPNLATNPTARMDPLGVSTFLSRLAAARAASAGTTGASKTAAGKATGKKAVKAKVSDQEFSAAGRTIDGYWLTARTEQRLRDLPLFSQATVSGRMIVGNAKENLNADSEVSFQGAVTVTGVTVVPGAGPIVKGHADFTLAIENAKTTLPGSVNADTEQDQTILRREQLDVVITYDDLAGTITLDLYQPGNQLWTAAPLPVIRVVRAASDAVVEYTLFERDDTSQPPALQPFARLQLAPDADVSRATNPLHQLASSGLDLVQAALIESEPSFESVANTQLFPALAPSTTEAPIQAVNDWVLFMKRRERTCADEPAPAPPLPPRSYRVLNLTVGSAAEAQKQIQLLRTNADALAGAVTKLTATGPDLVLGFQGGTSQPLFDPAAAEADWRQFAPAPGDRIAAVIYGARGDDDVATQTARLKRFEQAIAADSLEDPTVPSSQIDFPIVPFPDAAIPADADGIMLLITILSTETNHVYGVHDQQTWIALTRYLTDQKLEAGILAKLDDLGLATFKQGTGTPAGGGDANVVSSYQAKYGGARVTAATALYPSTDTTPEQQGRVAQSQQIVTDVGSQAQVLSQPYGGALPITDATAMTFVLAQANTRVARVVIEENMFDGSVQVVNSDPGLTITIDPQGPVGGLPNQILALAQTPQQTIVGAVAVGAGTDAVSKDVGALLPLLVAAQIIPAGIAPEPARSVILLEQSLLSAGIDELIILSSSEVG